MSSQSVSNMYAGAKTWSPFKGCQFDCTYCVPSFQKQAKKPEYFQLLLPHLPENLILVTTLETNRDAGYEEISKAPPPSERYQQFKMLDYPRKVVTIEPVLAFDPDIFSDWIRDLQPEYVWLGFDSKPRSVPSPEPSREEVLRCAESLTQAGTTVREKDLRGDGLPADDPPAGESPPVVTQPDREIGNAVVEQQQGLGYDTPVSSSPPSELTPGHSQSRSQPQSEQGYPSMAEQPATELIIPDEKPFDYDQLKREEAEQLRATAKRIRDKVKKSFASIVEIGRELKRIKASLGHGRFGAWLKAEFGWGERNARNFMAVAKLFKGKTANFADLSVEPSAAYLLASPSTPEEIRTQAIEQAKAGEHVGFMRVKEMLQQARDQSSEPLKRVSGEVLQRRLTKTLDRYLEKCADSDQATFAKLLREFADRIDPKKTRGTKKKKTT